MEPVSFIAIATFGLLVGFGHCIGMCGGIVIAYATAKIKAGQSKLYQFFAHLAYGLGRTTSYAVLGGIVGLLGSVFAITPTMRAVVLAIAGVLMILIGLSLMGKLNILNSAQNSGLSETGWFKRTFARLIASPSFGSFYGLGVMNGFLPCGPVYTALAMTLPLASVAGGATGMAIYGLATIPALLVLGTVVGFMKEFRYRDLFNRLAAISVILFGLYTLFKAWRLYMSPAMMMGGMEDGSAMGCH